MSPAVDLPPKALTPPRPGLVEFSLLEAYQKRLRYGTRGEGRVAAIEFTNNHQDLSTDEGFQLKLFCERCGDGFGECGALVGA
jgi:hypothetical protein